MEPTRSLTSRISSRGSVSFELASPCSRMSGGHMNDTVQTLFSFELWVENIRVDKDAQVSDELALGVRLLDFPTLLVYQPQHHHCDDEHPGEHAEDERGHHHGDHPFNRGKSCFFLMNLNSLHSHLSHTPLYAMVLDVKEEIPRLVGSSLISLDKVMDRVMQDVAQHGVSAPSSHGERGLFGVCSLTGEQTGSISLSYKLLSLGTSLLPHVADWRGLKSRSMHGGQRARGGIEEENISTESQRLAHSPTLDKSDGNIPNTAPASANNCKDMQDVVVCVATEDKPRSQIPQTLQETGNCYEKDLSLFCPPHLYYSSSAQSKNEGWVYKHLPLDSNAFTFEDSCSETSDNKFEAPSSVMLDQRVRSKGKALRNKETSIVSPNALGETLQQLPLLNALLVELSQLNNQSPQQPMSIHPNLAWIYRPGSTELSAEHKDTPRKTLEKSRQGTSPCLKHLHPPRNCSTPIVRPSSAQKKDNPEQALIERKSSSKPTRKKLVYGTTRTFNLRLKQVSHHKVKHRECVELMQNQKQTSTSKGKPKALKSSQRISVLNQSSSFNENIETMMQSISVDSTIHQQKKQHWKVQDEEHRDPLRGSEEPSLSERRDLKCIHIPSMDSDRAQSKDQSERHSESNRSQSERDIEKIKSPRSSRHSSNKSSFSDSSREGNKEGDYTDKGNEEADYADDFDSLEPSDADSSDPVSSPEPSRGKTPKSPVRLDFHNPDWRSESVQRRAVLPVPLKAPSSPQRSLKATHIIRPRNHASALSLSSEDGDRDESDSLRTVCSRKQMTESSRAERSSRAESFVSSRCERSKSTKNSSPLRGLSVESTSSFEPQEAEEVQDELGSLDFGKVYQHVSELVANKLPGYTM
ncbi:microtubule-associated protein 10 [Platichthys flesus]|uniref:microtubule-associated protein 10 n=1 Tax=Platichthys flesus TaxID=8260 RepID=UPI002DBAACE0|nr:microtubule-associated protein 10 [Platichthys flesus]